MTQQPDMTYTPRREPVTECHQLPESPIAERAYTAEQLERLAARQREAFADRFAQMEAQGNG